MRTNPFYDALLFLAGQTGTHDAIGGFRYLFAAFSIALVLAGIAIAVEAWRRDPAQRTPTHAAIFLMRGLIGGMWLEGSLWKLPLPGGLPYWLGLMGQNAAFDWYGAVIRDFLLPNIGLIGVAIWLTETILATALITGCAVRLASLLGIAMSLNLWIGLYHYQAEWPWTYVFIVIIHVFFIVTHAGRSLGLDGGPCVRSILGGTSLLGRIYGRVA